MEQMNVLDVVADVSLSEIVVNKSLPADVREGAADLLTEGHVTADLMAIEKSGEVALVIVPNGETDNNHIWKRLSERIFGKEDMSPNAEKRLISRNIAKGLASVTHPFTKSKNDFDGVQPCLICGSVVETSICEPLDKAIGFPFTFNSSPVDNAPDDSSDDSTTDGALQVNLDPNTVAAILQAV